MISFCIPLKNNLRYFKRCHSSIVKNSDAQYEIIVYLDSDNDGAEKYLIENKIQYIKNTSKICQGISKGYNECIKAASGDIVLMFHADMTLGPKALSKALEHISDRTVVVLTRIEPPLHPSGKEKIIQNFGFWPEENIADGFKEKEFESFVISKYNENKTTKGIFAPWMIYKKDIISIGLHDELFHSYHEDSDIFNRFVLNGYNIIQTWNSLVYHLTCRGGQFQDGLTVTNDPVFHKMKDECMKNYIRKWQAWIKNDEYHYPIIKNKYNIGLKIANCNTNIIRILEPWFTNIYADCDCSEYIKLEQPNTVIDLSKRVKNITDTIQNDIIVEFDSSKLTQEAFDFLVGMLSDVIKDSGEVGTFEYEIFRITINKLNHIQNDLILCHT